MDESKLEDKVLEVWGTVEADAQPYIDKANQIDSVIVTIGVTRLVYTFVRKLVVYVVRKIKEKRRGDTQCEEGVTPGDDTGEPSTDNSR